MSMDEERARQGGNAESSPVKAKAEAMDDELAAALALSMGGEPQQQDVEMTEDDEVQRAIAMSMQDSVLFFNIRIIWITFSAVCLGLTQMIQDYNKQ